MPDVSLRRFDAYVGIVTLPNMWRLTKRADQLVCTLMCTLATHPLGWELRVLQGEELRRSQVCKAEADVFDTAEAWKAEALARGWRE